MRVYPCGLRFLSSELSTLSLQQSFNYSSAFPAWYIGSQGLDLWLSLWFNQDGLKADLVLPLPDTSDVLELTYSACQDSIPCSIPRIKILFPILCLMTHCWEFADNHGGSIYIMEIGKCYKSTLLPYIHFFGEEPVVKELPDTCCYNSHPPLDSFGT